VSPSARRSKTLPQQPARPEPSPESRLTYSYRPPALRRILLAVLLVVLLAGGGIAAWAVLGRSDEAPSGAPEPPPSSATTASPAAPDAPPVRAARAVLTRWSAPDLPYARWWAGLRPLLAPGGREAYAATDPQRVPPLGPLGRPRMSAGPSRDTTTVWFGTDDGRYGVDLTRAGGGEPWRGVRILFPGQSSGFR
jgi:hypothetical protein